VVKNVSVRFYLDKPLHKKAYEFLKNQSDFPTISAAVINAVIDFYDKQESENRLVEKIANRLSGFSASPPILETAEVQTDEDILANLDLGFLGG
jgi:predicted nucleic acid-binding protein